MKRNARVLFSFILIGCLAIIGSAAGKRRGHTTIKGQIIAYRPAERALQVASHNLNRESFLFKVSTTESNSQPVVVKVVYEHFGYSDLGTDVLEKAGILEVRVNRDTTCDETYGAFVQNSPTVKEMESKSDSSEKVLFVGAFQTVRLFPEQLVKCYRLRTGDFQLQEQSQR